MVKRTQMKTVADYLRWERYLEADQVKHLREKVGVPSVVDTGVFTHSEAPQSLDGITLEELCRLQDIAALRGCIFAAGEVLLGMTPPEVLKAPLLPMLGLRNMVERELARIAALFEGLTREFTAAEIMAGAEKLNFGMFGLADWYARRMGLGSHDDAFATPWIRIYQCRKNDLEEAEYRERLQEIRTREMNQQHSR